MAATYAATPGSWFSSSGGGGSGARSSPVRIPFPSNRNNNNTNNNNDTTRNKQRYKRIRQQSADANMLSKSLGNYSHYNFVRQSTNVIKVSYAGCLYKRSNDPVTTSQTSFTEINSQQKIPQITFEPLNSPSQNDSNVNEDESAAWKFACALMDLPLDLKWTKEIHQQQQQQQQQQQALSSSPIPVPLTSLAPRRIHSQNNEGYAYDDQQEEDIIANDGHVWRARYCVLEEGVLYFYRNRDDAESEIAIAEREGDHQANQEAYEYPATNDAQLSSSLRPSAILAASPRVTRARTHFWEKRVPLSCVGAVRSAEAEYGPHALELSSTRNSTQQHDNEDVLILKARNANEMNEWLFQFHRSIEVWVKNFASLYSTSIVGEMIVPESAARWLSPRVATHNWTTAIGGGPVLSHGHGRSSLHRRRVEEEEQQKQHQQQQDCALPQNVLPLMPMTATATRSNYNHHQPSLPLRPSTPPANAMMMMEAVDESPQPVFELQDVEPLSPELSPEQTAPIPPEVQRHPAPPKGKYVPPHLRNRQGSGSTTVTVDTAASSSTSTSQRSSLSLAERLMRDESATGEGASVAAATAAWSPPSSGTTVVAAAAAAAAAAVAPINLSHSPKTKFSGPLILGGCADPDHVKGSILDARYIPRKASKLYRTVARPFGMHKGHWEIGAVSECGVRDANEDAYLIVGDLRQAFDAAAADGKEDTKAGRLTASSSFDELDLEQTPGLFCVFDGHCGDHAARYAAERFTHYLYQESSQSIDGGTMSTSHHVEQLIRRALTKLDHDFCELCVQDGRVWESGATALVAALFDDDLVIANLGDARGVLSRTVEEDELADWVQNGWTFLPEDEAMVQEDGGETSSNDDNFAAGVTTSSLPRRRPCVWKCVTETHSPSREDERRRIENANGWITTEAEIPVSQAHRLDLHDELARDILNRTLSRANGGAAAPHRLIQISRVCGELAVSRALGDRDFKALSDPNRARAPAVAPSSQEVIDAEESWQGSCFLPYPESHSRSFQGDLVSNVPEVQTLRICQPGVSDEFLLLACDGLWDVMDSDDAIRVTRRLLLDEGWSVKNVAARLAKLAVHLGSSDNVTVLIIRFVEKSKFQS